MLVTPYRTFLSKFPVACVPLAAVGPDSGEQFVWQALERGAAKVYAAAWTPKNWPDPRIQPLALDITDANAVANAAAADVDMLINNAAAWHSARRTNRSRAYYGPSAD